MIRLIWNNPVLLTIEPGKPALQIKADKAKMSSQQRRHLFDAVTFGD